MKNNRLLMRVGKQQPWLAIALLCFAGTSVYAGDLTTDNLTVNKDATIYGNLEVKAVGSPPTSGLMFYFSLNTNTNTVPDDSGNNHTGTVYGATWTTNGISGGAYSFDGSDDYIRAPYTDTDTFQGSFSLSVWAYVNNCDNNPGILGTYSAVSANYINYLQPQPDGEIAFMLAAPWLTLYSGTTYPTGWHHIVAVRDVDADKVYLYVDDACAAETTDTTTSTPAPSFVEIGKYPGQAAQYLNGDVDEIRIYNRALAASEVSGLYFNGSPPTNNYARFEPGVSYIHPLGDLGMGVYTNQP